MHIFIIIIEVEVVNKFKGVGHYKFLLLIIFNYLFINVFYRETACILICCVCVCLHTLSEFRQLKFSTDTRYFSSFCVFFFFFKANYVNTRSVLKNNPSMFFCFNIFICLFRLRCDAVGISFACYLAEKNVIIFK